MIEGLVQSAQKIVKAISKQSPFPISLTDEHGKIIGDSNQERIGTIHSPSKKVISLKKPVKFDEETVKQYDNVLPGIAVPLTFGYKTVGVLGIIGDPEEVEPYALLLKNYVEMLWKEIYQSQQDSLYSHTIERFAQYVLLNNELDTEQTRQYASDLKISIEQKRIVVIITLNRPIIYYAEQTLTPIEQKKLEITSIVRDFFHAKHDLCTFISYEKLVLWKSVVSDKHIDQFASTFHYQASKCQQCLSDLQIPTCFSAGTVSHSLYTLHQSYQRAEKLFRLAHRYNVSGEIYHYHNWEVLSKLIPEDINLETWDYFENFFSNFINREDFVELAKCFVQYCDHQMNVSRAAKSLYIHRNTLTYRLKKIEQLTSLDINDFYDCSILYMFINFYLTFTKYSE
ncbi:CdaR family transcriptional regulator [Piscibacillus salipiscarius]|uniref:CdaR family transcriptional regulator n=1 Tax=Piscibacillus salipiscarius TaxID=299480 RepID=A0ABW5QB03_9BACI